MQRRQSASWENVYQRYDSQNSDEESSVLDVPQSDHSPSKAEVVLNFRFASLLRQLNKNAIALQHEIACLSTLGGAYHLVNKPEVALSIAQRQERIGHCLGSTQMVVRAKVFQAVNNALLNNRKESHRLFQQCYRLLRSNPWLADLLQFVTASQLWLQRNEPASPAAEPMASSVTDNTTQSIQDISTAVHDLPNNS